MLGINVCHIHGNGVYEYRLSKEIVEDIKNDSLIDIRNIYYIDFIFEDNIDTYLVYEKMFIENKLKKKYFVSNHLYEDEEVAIFRKKYLQRICMTCVREYEKKHNLILTRNIPNSYPMF